MNFLKAHWPAIASILAGVMPFELPSIKVYIAHNPHTFLGVLLAAVVAAYYSKSPLQSTDGTVNPNAASVKT